MAALQRRRTLLLATGFVLVALTSFVVTMIVWELWQGGGPSLSSPSATVAEVLAADQLRLQSGETVRLAAIEVPASGEPFAEEGRQAARALVRGQPVRLDGPLDGAYVFLPDGATLQELLVVGGYARVAADAPADETVGRLREAEAGARAGGLGVWGGSSPAAFPTPLPTSQPVACDGSLIPGDAVVGAATARERLGEQVDVVFFATRTESQSGSVTLLAGLDGDDFGVVVPTELAAQADDVATTYVGRCLVVSGRVERAAGSPGPRIILRDWAQLLVLR